MEIYRKIKTIDRLPVKSGFYPTDWNVSTEFINNHFISISGGIVDNKVEWWMEKIKLGDLKFDKENATLEFVDGINYILDILKQ